MEKKSWKPYVLYLLVVIIGAAVAGYVGIRLSASRLTQKEPAVQAESGAAPTAGAVVAEGALDESEKEPAAGTEETPEGGILEPEGLLEEEEEAPDTEPDPYLVYPESYSMTLSGFDTLPFSKDELTKALGDFGYENGLTITRADYAGELTGNARNAVCFGIQANGDPGLYITGTWYRDYRRFLFIFDERTASVVPSGQGAGTGSASGANPYTADDLVIYDIPNNVYAVFRSEEGFRQALYAYLAAQGIYTDIIVAGEWYEVSGETAVFVLEAQGKTIQATYDVGRDAYAFS